eukprot:765518-Hanusia_phi.AAC.2
MKLEMDEPLHHLDTSYRIHPLFTTVPATRPEFSCYASLKRFPIDVWAQRTGSSVPACRERRAPLDLAMMPEGPECKRMADELSRFQGNVITKMEILSGRYVDNGAPKNFDEFSERMIPAKIDKVGNKGKFIYFLCSSSRTPGRLDLDRCRGRLGDLESKGVNASIWSTLGMSGRWSITQTVHTRFVMEMVDSEDKDLSVYYNDVRNFGTLAFSLDPAELESKLDSIGPAFLDGLTALEFIKIAKRQKESSLSDGSEEGVAMINLCNPLTEIQTSGIGNYILSECLYKSKLDPWSLVGDLNEEQWMTLFHAVQETIFESYRSSGLSRLGAQGVRRIGMYEGLDGEAGHYTDKLLVTFPCAVSAVED